jgi:hypothetical protein
MTYQTNAFAHGIGNGAVSAQWWSRPADEKFLSLDAMLAHKKADARRLDSRIVNTHKIKVVGEIDEANPTTGSVLIEYTDENRSENATAPTHWSFRTGCDAGRCPGRLSARPTGPSGRRLPAMGPALQSRQRTGQTV